MQLPSRALDRRYLGYWFVFLASLAIIVASGFTGLRYAMAPHGGCLVDPSLRVTVVWQGKALHPDDLIERADGVAIATKPDLLAFYAHHRTGDPVTYLVRRNGHDLTVTLPMRREPPEFLLQIALDSLVGLAFVLIGFFPFLLKPDRIAARVLLLQTAFDAAFFAMTPDWDSASSWYRLEMVVLLLVGASLMELGWVFPSPVPRLQRLPRRRGWPYVLGGVLAFIGLWVSYFVPMDKEAFPDWFTVAQLWMSVGLLVMIATLLVGAYRRPREIERHQATIACWGMAAAALPSVVLLVLPDVTGFQLPLDFFWRNILAYAFMPVFPAAIAYAIVKTRLFDIDLIIKRTLVYATVTGALSGIYFLLAGSLRYLSGLLLGAHSAAWSGVLATATVAVAFVPVRDRTQLVVDRIFHRSKYDFRSLLARFVAHAQETLDLDALMAHYLEIADEAIHPHHVEIMVRKSPYSREMQVIKTIGASPMPDDFVLRLDRQGTAELASAERSGLRTGKATTRQLVHLEALDVAFTVPLSLSGEVLGAITFGPKRSDLDYTAEDRELLLALGAHLASSVRTAELLKDHEAKIRLDQELATAKRIQESLLPTLPATIGDDMELAASSEPAYEFGGDFYDLLPLPGGFAVAVGDVAGKGVQAALIMAMAKSCLYQIAQGGAALAPAEVLAALNGMILDTVEDRTYRKMSLLFGVLEADSGRFRYASAGHQAPHHYVASDRSCRALPFTGAFPLGASKLGRYTEHEVRLAPGDALVLYTDGITEAAAPGGETFFEVVDTAEEPLERDRLKETVEALAEQSAEAIRIGILKAVARFTEHAPAEDDRTLVVIKVPPGSPP